MARDDEHKRNTAGEVSVHATQIYLEISAEIRNIYDNLIDWCTVERVAGSYMARTTWERNYM